MPGLELLRRLKEKGEGNVIGLVCLLKGGNRVRCSKLSNSPRKESLGECLPGSVARPVGGRELR